MQKEATGMTDDLKPCPFCGEAQPPHDDTSWVRCLGCGAETGWRPTGDEAIAAWNTRTPDPRIEALTAERDMATEGWAEATRLIDVARQQYGAEKSRAEAAEAKLAKAVEALEVIRDRQYYRMGPGITAQVIARATLAEIEGEKE
jgi:Lar family restriction alleviation protein